MAEHGSQVARQRPWKLSGPWPRNRSAPDTATVAVAQDKITLCKLLGVGACRCVYAVGARYAIKYEYGDPVGRGSNIKEASLAAQFPVMLPWTFELNDGCLLVRQAAYTVEHLIRDVSDYAKAPGDGADFGKFCGLIKGVLEWAVWLVEFATKNGLRLNDASPRNTGYDPVDENGR